MIKQTLLPPAFILHAGAGAYPKDLRRARRIRKKLGDMTAEGLRLLTKKSARETVVEVVRWLEDLPETNAGAGSALQADGKARLSASVMDGYDMRFSGVINIEKIKNPIRVARLLQRKPDRILAGEGALAFAREEGFVLRDTRTEESIRRWKTLRAKQKAGHYGTVGACALDQAGCLAAATSTGGKGMERAGRVSDSALPPGNFANSFAAVSATGVGEHIIEEALASTLAVRALDSRNLRRAFQTTFKEARLRGRLFAAIGVDINGNIFWDQTTEILYYAFKASTRSGVFDL